MGIPKRLTNRQQAFLKFYAEIGIIRRAAFAAGYARRTASNTIWRSKRDNPIMKAEFDRISTLIKNRRVTEAISKSHDKHDKLPIDKGGEIGR